MKRRDYIYLSTIIILVVFCALIYQRGNGLKHELDAWEAHRFELTRRLSDLQKQFWVQAGRDSESMDQNGDVYAMNLLDRDQFTQTFLTQTARLSLAMNALKRNDLEQGTDDNLPDIWPTEGTITSLFGLRKHPIYKQLRFHSGVDIANLKNTEILAAAGGTVKTAGPDGGYGNVVILDHGNGFESIYGHAEDILVSVGDVVTKGDLIASMGSTGVSTGEHLHFEVRFAGEAVDPIVFLK